MKKAEKSEKARERKIYQRLRLFNPKNLERAVHVYGYHFSWKAYLLVVLCALLGITAIGILFRLKVVYFTVVVAAVCATLPMFILYMYKRMYEQKRFSDAVTYAEQILYSFQKNGKVVSALKEAREIFEPGQMLDAMDDAIAYLETGQAETDRGLLREALDRIERQYACAKVHMVHELLIGSEEHGGDSSQSIMLVLNDIEVWKRRGYRLQADKKQSHTDNIISIAVATVLCAVALYVLNAMGRLYPGVEGVGIFAVGIIQVSSFVFILFLLFVLRKSFRSLTENWLKNDSLYSEQYALSSYDAVVNYDNKRETKKSILFSLPFFVGAVLFLIFEKNLPGIICIAIGILLLMQHRIGYNLARKDINRELYIALPQWLMNLALLLQNNNVQVSIAKSMMDAPPVLRRELEQLMERLQKEPGRLQSYTSFCKDFDVPEIQSCMKMLHAFSESGTGNTDVQINNLIQRVSEMQNMADEIRNERIAFRIKMIFSLPIFGATAKLLVDLSVGMIYMFQLLKYMGGV